MLSAPGLSAPSSGDLVLILCVLALFAGRVKHASEQLEQPFHHLEIGPLNKISPESSYQEHVNIVWDFKQSESV